MSNSENETINNYVIHNLSLRAIKILNIAYLFTAASIIGYIVARLLARVFKFNEAKYKNKDGIVTKSAKIKLAIDIILEMALIGIVIYLSRQITQMLPFPFDGWKGIGAPDDFTGYRQNRLKEWANPYPIAFFIIFFQDQLRAKILYFTKINNF
jgi:hypothetical protein